MSAFTWQNAKCQDELKRGNKMHCHFKKCYLICNLQNATVWTVDVSLNENQTELFQVIGKLKKNNKVQVFSEKSEKQQTFLGFIFTVFFWGKWTQTFFSKKIL